MAKLKKGSEIGVPATVKPGPFSGERLISFETMDGPISGFVRDSELTEASGQWYVRAVVDSIEKDSLNVRVRGSFFTSNGMATISREVALAA